MAASSARSVFLEGSHPVRPGGHVIGGCQDLDLAQQLVPPPDGRADQPLAASYEEMKARTVAVAQGKRRIAPNEPKVWFTSTESFAKVLSAGNRELLRVIAEKAPGSLDELARITGKAKSNLSRTLRTMEGYGLVRLERGERGRITPKVMHDRVELDLPLTISRKAS
jgi:predicted transcriptional regulator